MTVNTNQILPSSFRDPSGFVFEHEGLLFRQINKVYQKNWDQFMSSGLYQALVDEELIIPHQEVTPDFTPLPKAYKVIAPEKINFISYPYEWCFSQLKDAAITTLRIQELAIEKGMSLKDASAYNIQFRKGKPVFIDSLSFEKCTMDRPWVAYRQFCQHFLAPLALMSYTDIRLNQLLKGYIDGIPLDLASTLLPGRTKMNFSILSHIHLHAKSQRSYSGKQVQKKNQKISKLGFIGLMNSLKRAVNGLNWNPSGTEWADYYEDTNYSDQAFVDKKEAVKDLLDGIKADMAWDIGANTGIFSRLISEQGTETISFDIDFSAVEKNYRQSRLKKEIRILPLLLDLTNPSPNIGWHNQERESLINRGPADVVLALALVHHLAISNNLPFAKIGQFFADICQQLIIEFIPKNDSQVQRLLASREDIFRDYDQQNFEKEFQKIFKIVKKREILHSHRTLYLMVKR